MKKRKEKHSSRHRVKRSEKNEKENPRRYGADILVREDVHTMN